MYAFLNSLEKEQDRNKAVIIVALIIIHAYIYSFYELVRFFKKDILTRGLNIRLQQYRGCVMMTLSKEQVLRPSHENHLLLQKFAYHPRA